MGPSFPSVVLCVSVVRGVRSASWIRYLPFQSQRKNFPVGSKPRQASTTLVDNLLNQSIFRSVFALFVFDIYLPRRLRNGRTNMARTTAKGTGGSILSAAGESETKILTLS